MVEHAKRIGFNWSSTIVYILFAALVCGVIGLQSHNSKVADRERCEASVDTRNVSRKMVEAIYGLATSPLVRDDSSPALTPAQVNVYNAYITRANDFRDKMYKLIQPSDICAPYVPDEPNEPPTPNVSLLPIPKEGA